MTYPPPGPWPNPGPPPRRPVEPQYYHTTHVLHLLLTLITFGLWAIVWLIIGLTSEAKNGKLRHEYEVACARWEHDYWLWDQAQQEWRHWRYNPPPH